VRWPALVLGVILLAVAVAAFTRVADTRAGLVAEVVTLLAGMAGLSLVIYGLAVRKRTATARSSTSSAGTALGPRSRSRNDLLLGAGGIALAIVLLSGLILSAGIWWGLFGLLLLLPMIAGSIYLFVRYLRASP
jgi:hypothetical protein